jgi:hypothetical protein
MSQPELTPPTAEETPVDDVRKVRARLDREAGGEVHALVEASRRVSEELRAKLGLRRVAPPREQKE